VSTVTILAFYVPKTSAAAQFYADPDPTFHFDVVPDPDLDRDHTKFYIVYKIRIFASFYSQ
jgi:hypothetical protein